jgi:hypothetical protein
LLPRKDAPVTEVLRPKVPPSKPWPSNADKRSNRLRKLRRADQESILVSQFAELNRRAPFGGVLSRGDFSATLSSCLAAADYRVDLEFGGLAIAEITITFLVHQAFGMATSPRRFDESGIRLD